MKTILSKIYPHPMFLITILFFILLGRFRMICYFTILITIHELGHIITGIYFKWKINKIIILPFGMLTKFDIDINTKLIEEFIVSISGIVFQYIFYIIVKNYVSYSYFSYINTFIILFNLIPINPLDGYKILNVFINKITSFYNSLYVSSYISFILIILLNVLLFNINKMIIFVSIFLLIETIKNYKNSNNIFNKFLLERYLKKYRFKYSKKIKSTYEMKKDYKHLFYVDNKCITEYTFLLKMFDIKGKV